MKHVRELVLSAAAGLASGFQSHPVLVGFDGFVDEIIHVVKQRESADHYTRMEKMAEFGQRGRAKHQDAAGTSGGGVGGTGRVSQRGTGGGAAGAWGSARAVLAGFSWDPIGGQSLGVLVNGESG